MYAYVCNYMYVFVCMHVRMCARTTISNICISGCSHPWLGRPRCDELGFGTPLFSKGPSTDAIIGSKYGASVWYMVYIGYMRIPDFGFILKARGLD